jgi:hypothetical protein
VSRKPRTIEDIRKEQQGLCDLMRDNKISKNTFDYLMGKLDEELRAMGAR